MWALLVAGLSFFGTCNVGMQGRNNNNKGDTVLLFKKDTLVTTGIAPSVLSCSFSASTHVQYNSRFKTLLLLENSTVITLPEGVYEVYINYQPPDINNLSSSQPEFVNVLDLYSLTAPAASRRLEVDISEQIKKLFLLKQPLPAAYISIRFGAIKLPDGSYTTKTGELRFTGIQIVQVNN